MAVFMPADKGPSQPDLTQEALKNELSVTIKGKRLPSPILRPSALYQKVSNGEQPVALSENGRPTQAFTSFTAWEGADGSVLTVNDTSFDSITQVPAGMVEYRKKAFSLAPFSAWVARTESA